MVLDDHYEILTSDRLRFYGCYCGCIYSLHTKSSSKNHLAFCVFLLLTLMQNYFFPVDCDSIDSYYKRPLI